jgi:hypothetical protein
MNSVLVHTDVLCEAIRGRTNQVHTVELEDEEGEKGQEQCRGIDPVQSQ